MFENRKGMSRADLEQMSTDSLEKLLLDDFDSPEHKETDIDDLYMVAQVLAEREPLRRSHVDRAWERFQKNYLPFVKMADEEGVSPSSDDAQVRRHTPLRRWPVRAALAAAVLCALMLCVSVAAAANGYDFLKLLAQWSDEQVWLNPDRIEPVAEDDIHIPEEPKEYANIQEALEDYGFYRPVVPQWLPDGYVQEELITADLAGTQLIFHVLYKRGEDSLVFQVNIYLDYEGRDHGSSGNFQKDEGDPIPYEAGGITHLLAMNAGRPVALWADGPAECALSGNMTMDELKQMIDSIYE